MFVLFSPLQWASRASSWYSNPKSRKYLIRNNLLLNNAVKDEEVILREIDYFHKPVLVMKSRWCYVSQELISKRICWVRKKLN